MLTSANVELGARDDRRTKEGRGKTICKSDKYFTMVCKIASPPKFWYAGKAASRQADSHESP